MSTQLRRQVFRTSRLPERNADIASYQPMSASTSTFTREHAPATVGALHPDSAWWQAAAARLSSDWNGIMRLRTSIALLTCDICGAAPCTNPSFCRLCRQADAKAARMRSGAKTEWLQGLLDKGVSLERSYTELSNRPPPTTTIEAIKQVVRDRGLLALKELATRARLHNCDAPAPGTRENEVAATSRHGGGFDVPAADGALGGGAA